MTDSETNIVAFEGPPLMGKSTQAGNLQEYLQDRGYDVKVLKRAADYCPTREEINELREEADGWTRELERVTPEYETELWAEYYREKTEAIEEIMEEENPDYIIFDRYFLSLIPTQEPALDANVEQLVQNYREDIEALDPDITFLLYPDEDIFPERYRKREDKQIPEGFHDDMARVAENYRELTRFFDFTEIDATQTEEKVFNDIKQEMKDRNLIS